MVQKIFNNFLFRVMSTWFGYYIENKIEALQAWLKIINVGSQANVEEIMEYFSMHPEETQTTLMQAWDGESNPTLHVVYRNVMYVGGIQI